LAEDSRAGGKGDELTGGCGRGRRRKNSVLGANQGERPVFAQSKEAGQNLNKKLVGETA